MKGIQVCSNEGPRPSQRGDNWELIKINWQLLKILFSRTTGPILTKFDNSILRRSEFKFVHIKGHVLSPRGDNYEISKIHWLNLKNLLKIHWANFNQTWHKTSLGEVISGFFFKWRTMPFSKGDNYEMAKIHWRNLKIFFSMQIHWANFNQT